MGIENVEEMTSEGGRESSQAERDRHDEEIAAENKARQIRLGHVPDPNEAEEEEPAAKKPAAKKAAPRKKSE